MSLSATIKLNNNLEFNVAADDEVSLFKELARAQEVFAFSQCGKCNSPDIRFQCRQDKDENDWLELVCNKCRAKLPYGVTKKGGRIYPKVRWNHLSETQQQERKEEETPSGWLPNGGWFIYKKK